MAAGSRKAGGVARDRRGSVATIFALVAPALVGFTALGVEAGMWYTTKARLQEVADSAAMAADRELAAGTGKLAAAASLAAQMNNCAVASNCSTDTPTTFRTASSTIDNGVQVVARTTITPLFAGLFVPTNANGTMNVSATGKAAYTIQSTGGITGCVLGLDGNATYTVALNNNGSVNCNVMSNSKCQGPGSSTCTFDSAVYSGYACNSSIDPQCTANANTSSVSSLYLSNNARITATATAAGSIYLNNNAQVTKKVPNSTQAADPYANVTLTVPTSTAAAVATGAGTSGNPYDVSVAANTCSTGAITYANNVYVKIHPGCYNGWNIQNNAIVTLDPGTYIIKSQFVFQNNAQITGNAGTTLIFAGTGAASYAFNIGNNANLSIVAPSSGAYAGIALMGDPAGKETIVQTFSNNAVLNIKGAIYFRKQIIDLENNASAGGSNGCLQIIGRRVLLSNNANIGLNCAGVGTSDISIGQQVTKIVDIVQ